MQVPIQKRYEQIKATSTSLTFLTLLTFTNGKNQGFEDTSRTKNRQQTFDIMGEGNFLVG